MFSKVDYKHEPKPVVLTKAQSNYNKLQKEMNEAPKEYNSIKKLIESNENSIGKVSTNIQSKNVKLIAHKKRYFFI